MFTPSRKGPGAMAIDRNRNSYILKLNDRCAWNLAGTPGTEAWLDHFSSVLGLQAGMKEEFPRITFIRGRAAGPTGVDPRWPPDVAHLERLVQQGWEPNNLGLVRFWTSSKRSDLVGELLNSPAREIAILTMEQALQPLYSEAVKSSGIPLHGALVALDGQGVVLAGANDAGKTTACCRLPSRWKVLSDDETLLIRGKEEGYVAHPLPTWSDHWRSRSGQGCDMSQRVSLAAIFVLQQAPCVEVLPMGPARGAARINESARQASFWRLRAPGPHGQGLWSTALFDNACEIARKVPAYTLRLNLSGRFWEPIERLLSCL